jgi:hypothetical protein
MCTDCKAGVIETQKQKALAEMYKHRRTVAVDGPDSAQDMCRARDVPGRFSPQTRDGRLGLGRP